MSDNLAYIGRCDRVFGADQQEPSSADEFEWIEPYEEFEFTDTAGNVVARGDYYVRMVARWSPYDASYLVKYGAIYSDADCKHELSARDWKVAPLLAQLRSCIDFQQEGGYLDEIANRKEREAR